MGAAASSTLSDFDWSSHMDATAVARAKSVLNPFVSNRVDSAWDPDAVDVEAINHTAFERCSETIELVRSTGRCRGLLLSGEPGSGKTHLLQRLRRHVQHDGRDCFVYVPPVSGPDRFFRDLLQHTVQDLVGSRTGSPTSQLETLLVRELLRAEKKIPITAAFWADVRKRHAPGPALFSWLEGPMEKLCTQLELDPYVTRVLRHYLAEHRRSDAYAWLLGRSVPEEVLARLGVGRTLEEDADAMHALVTLSRLAGAHSVLVLAFDQLEGLQVDEKDQQGLRAFAAGLARLFVTCRNIATICCVQTYFKQDLERAVPPAHMDRLAQDQGALTPLENHSAMELVAHRLAAESELKEVRQTLGVSEPLWPLHRKDVEQAVTTGGISARRLLNHCRDRFEEWRRGETVVPLPTESLHEIWETRIEQAAAGPADEGVLADGLLKLLDARSPGKSKRGSERDVDVVISAPEGEIGVAVCHAENMSSLAARLKRLQTIAGSGRFKRLVLVRDERLRISPSAKATHDRLDALRAAGHTLLRPPAEAYAAVAAARQLLADAAAGDLSLNGQPVASEDLKAWLANNLNAPAAQLLDALGGIEDAKSDDIVERVQELLEGQWVVTASDIAASMGLDEAALVRRLTTQQRAVGVLTGPPTVLFLRPEGLRPE
jgi:hypothetical protein